MAAIMMVASIHGTATLEKKQKRGAMLSPHVAGTA